MTFEAKSSFQFKEGSQTPIKQGSKNSRPRVFVNSKIGAANDEHGKDLSDRLGVPFLLPRRAVPCTVDAMKTWLKRLGRTFVWHRKVYDTSLEEFIELNPRWPLRAWVGLMLEQVKGKTGTIEMKTAA